MSIIYKISNNINNKVYIGKTSICVNKRFKQHLADSKKEKNKKRPLYAAMNKHGHKNFYIESIEETTNPEEREVYWINFYKSYGSSGYNATKGGDGKPRVNEELILFYLKEITSNCNKISKILNYCNCTIVKIARKHNLYVRVYEPVKATKEIIELVFKLYIPGKKGFGRRKIAKVLNIKESLVNSILINYKNKQLVYGVTDNTSGSKPVSSGFESL